MFQFICLIKHLHTHNPEKLQIKLNMTSRTTRLRPRWWGGGWQPSVHYNDLTHLVKLFTPTYKTSHKIIVVSCNPSQSHMHQDSRGLSQLSAWAEINPLWLLSFWNILISLKCTTPIGITLDNKYLLIPCKPFLAKTLVAWCICLHENCSTDSSSCQSS